MNSLKDAFNIGKIQVGGSLKFNFSEITTNTKFPMFSMDQYTERIQPVTISRSKKYETDTDSTKTEEKNTAPYLKGSFSGKWSFLTIRFSDNEDEKRAI